MSAHAPAQAPDAAPAKAEKPPKAADATQEQAKADVAKVANDTHGAATDLVGADIKNPDGSESGIKTSEFLDATESQATDYKRLAVGAGVLATIALPVPALAVGVPVYAAAKTWGLAKHIPGFSFIDRNARKLGNKILYGVKAVPYALTHYPRKAINFGLNTVVKPPLRVMQRTAIGTKNMVKDWWNHEPGEAKSIPESVVDGFKHLGTGIVNAFVNHPGWTTGSALVVADVIGASLGYFPHSVTGQVIEAVLGLIKGTGTMLNGVGSWLGA